MADVIAPRATPDVFSARERDYIRRELDMFFSSLPSVAEGFVIRNWTTGAQAGQPKIPTAAADMLARGLLRLDVTERRRPRLFFTEQGLVALRAMMSDRRLVNPIKFAHIRQELAIEPRTAPIGMTGGSLQACNHLKGNDDV